MASDPAHTATSADRIVHNACVYVAVLLIGWQYKNRLSRSVTPKLFDFVFVRYKEEEHTNKGS